jgi:hypothetical protein
VPLLAAHRQRAYDLLLGVDGVGVSPFTIQADRFHRVPDPVDRVPLTGAERAVQVVFEPPASIGFTNPLDGRDLSAYPMIVRVSYVRTGQGEVWDATGSQSGGADEDSVEDRALMDGKTIRDVLGWQANWTGLDPFVIDCEPDPAQSKPTVDGDRYVYEHTFSLKTRASLPGSYGPSLT